MIERTCDSINAKDKQAFRELQDSDIVQHDGREVFRGIDAVTDRMWTVWAAFPDLTITPETIISEGDMVAMWYTGAGTHQGEFNGIEPTGNEFEVSELKMYRVNEGKVAEVWGVSDQLGMFTQLGLMEPPISD